MGVPTRSGTSRRLCAVGDGRLAGQGGGACVRTPVEEGMGLVGIVAAAPQLDILDGGLAPYRPRFDMVELHEGPRVAPTTGLAHERAAPEVA
jgi:hypothetical protein